LKRPRRVSSPTSARPPGRLGSGCEHAGNFGSQVLAAAQAKKMGILTLKAMARGPWPKDAKRQQYPECRYEPLADPADAMMGLRFTFPSWA